MKEQLVNYWRSLKEQEQQLVMIAGAVFVIFVLVMGIFRPLNNAIEKAEQDNINSKNCLLGLMRASLSFYWRTWSGLSTNCLRRGCLIGGRGVGSLFRCVKWSSNSPVC